MTIRLPGRALVLGILIGFCAAAAVACSGSRKKSEPASAPTPPPPFVQPAPVLPPPPPPPPGEREMAEAASLLEAGDPASAAAKLDAVIALGTRAPARPDAIYLRALLAARPDLPGRDISLARDLLGQILDSGPTVARASEVRLVLALLDLEEASARAIADLTSQIETMRAETEHLRAELAQRRDELRRIKEILLEKTPGS